MSEPTRRFRRSATRGLAATLAVLLLAACTSSGDGEDDAAPEPEAPATGEPMELDVLVYNVEYGGNASTDKVIRSLDADVVGVLESYNRLPEIAEKTGYPYYNVGLQLLSKYPIHEPSGADGLYALIEVQPGYAVGFVNTHLDYVAYGPRLLREGTPVADVIASENEVRTSSIDVMVPSVEKLIGAGYPMFLTGDLNEPSSLDYGEETVGSREGVTEVVPWPVSETLIEAGLQDTYREIHPDPLENPGLTHDAGDRIDYVYAGGPLETIDSRLVGEEGGQDVELGFEPWTSDHRAVLSTFQLEPTALPTTVSLDHKMMTEGDRFRVYYNAPGAEEITVAVVPEGGDPEAALDSQSVESPAGMLDFDTAELEPGGYEVVMLDESGAELGRNQFWVRSSRADVQITTDKTEYDVGEPIEVTWDDGPANRWDWIGVFAADAADSEGGDPYLLWGYTGGHDSGALPPTVDGSMTLDEDSQGKGWPLPPGDYVVHYLLTDQYVSGGNAEFTVVG